MITVLHVKTTTVWILPTASKQPPIRIILFMLTTLNDENHTCRHVRVNEDGALEKPADVTNLNSAYKHEKNGVFQQKHQWKYIDAKCKAHDIAPHLTLYGMEKGP